MDIDRLEFQPGLVKQGLAESERAALLDQLHGWHIEGDQPAMLVACFEFNDFAGAIAFASRVGDLAESFNHHPELVVSYGKVTVKWWTHTAGGVAANDFIMARETSRIADTEN